MGRWLSVTQSAADRCIALGHALEDDGDFAGALVDIRTREFPAQRSVSVQFNGGYSSGSSGSRLISARGVPWVSRGKPMFLRTFMCG